MPEDIDLRSREVDLRALFDREAPPGATLEIVDSVQDWALSKGFPEENPFRQATSFPARGLVVMKSVLTENSARSSSSVLRIGPLAHEALAQDLWKYARFLLLHEIAHLFGMLTESEADHWALARLNEHLVEAKEDPIGTWG